MIEKAISKDVKELSFLENSVFSKDDFALSDASFYYHIKNSYLFVYKKNKKVIGYILFLKRKKFSRLYSLCISKEFQGKGIAQKLLNYSFKTIKSEIYTLEVKSSNKSAIKLYEKNSFKIKKILKEYYSESKNGYLMVRKNASTKL